MLGLGCRRADRADPGTWEAKSSPSANQATPSPPPNSPAKRPSSYFDGLVAAICRRWLEDGKPKAIVRVPPMQGGKSGELVSRLKQALAGHGARVLDATGTGALDKQRFLSALEAEKNRTHAASAFDVMVGIRLSWKAPTGRCAVRSTASACRAR